jgi:CDP-diacylglycerol---glycerol-3-phosphate 3-phosphatidyltransferase
MITPNHLTVLRVFIALASPPLLILFRSPSVEALVTIAFTAACISDWWDGHLARTRSMITSFGKILDPIADKLLLLGLMMSFTYLKIYAFEWIVLIVIREAAVTLTRVLYLTRGRALHAERAGKVKVGFQIGSVYASLVLMMVIDAAVSYAIHPSIIEFFRWLNYLGLVIANALTVSSGIQFFKNLDTR